MGNPLGDFAPLLITAQHLIRDIDIAILVTERKYSEAAQKLLEASQLLRAASELLSFHATLEKAKEKANASE